MDNSKFVKENIIEADSASAISLIECGMELTKTELEYALRCGIRPDVREAINKALSKNEFREDDIVVAETDLKPIETKKTTAGCDLGIPMLEIQKDNGLSYLAERTVEWHEAAIQHAQIAVICAARAGAELNHLKSQCKHGEWQKVLNDLPFSGETARKYRGLADQLQQQLQQVGTGVELLELPNPSNLSDPIYADELAKINEVTGEQTLRQLYFDWGIIKQKPKPQPPEPKQLPPGETEIHDRATHMIFPVMEQIRNLMIFEETSLVQHMNRKELEHLEGDLTDALKRVKDLVKAG